MGTRQTGHRTTEWVDESVAPEPASCEVQAEVVGVEPVDDEGYYTVRLEVAVRILDRVVARALMALGSGENAEIAVVEVEKQLACCGVGSEIKPWLFRRGILDILRLEQQRLKLPWVKWGQ